MQEVFGEKDEQGNFTGRYSTGGQIFNNLSEARRAAGQYVPGDPVPSAPVLTVGGFFQTMAIVLGIFGTLIYFFNHPLNPENNNSGSNRGSVNQSTLTRPAAATERPALPNGCYWIDDKQSHCPNVAYSRR